MAATGDTTEPAIHFKRRKIAHPRKTYTDDASAAIATSDAVPQVLQAPSPAPAAADAPLQATTLENEVEDDGDEESVPNLKEIFRQRKRPRDRLKEAARKAAEKRAGPLVLSEAPAANDQYSGRFVAQTGQVVDKDDAQMYVFAPFFPFFSIFWCGMR